jgi:anthranilate phosphoribosyltransferase
MKLKPYIEKVLERQHLTSDEAAEALELIMTDQGTDTQIAALLVALRAKGETIEELVGFARTMRRNAVRIHVEDECAIDMCGTGGDGLGTFNISTISAIVAAGAGATVAKHGNRSVSSRSGSADVLAALGVNVQLAPEHVGECVNTVGIGFLFAPLFHPAMKYAAKTRTELGIRTIFNMLGPITNPAGVRRQVIGTYHPSVAVRLAGALRTMDSGRAYVIHSADGMDEVGLSGLTHVQEVAGDAPVREYALSAGSFGLDRQAPDGVKGGDAVQNAEITRRILEGNREPGRDVVIANAALGVYVAGKAGDLKEASLMAAEAIDSGRAKQALHRLVEFTNQA